MQNLKIVQKNNIKIKYNKKFILIGLFVLMILITFIFLGWLYYKHEYHLINYKERYQAVFLNNGQVYFGNISKENDDTIILENVYYLKMNDGLQNADEAKDNQDNHKLSLVKLGNEIHGPLDTMYIVRSNVLFTEELKNDSQVVQAINSYKE